jgi:predicted RNA-binding protein associated with RNAse of E/G family
MTSSLPVIASGDWQRASAMHDYRAEWFSDILVERATWSAGTAPQQIGALMTAAPDFIWCRFWGPEASYVVEKYFDAQGIALGIYVRVGMTLPHHGRGFSLVDLLLGIWLTGNGRVTVYNEAHFDQAVKRGEVTPVEAEHAEMVIRELTTAIAQKRFPVAFVRNFTLAVK